MAHTVVLKDSYLNITLFQPQDTDDEQQTVYVTNCEFPLKRRLEMYNGGTSFVMRAGIGDVYI